MFSMFANVAGAGTLIFGRPVHVGLLLVFIGAAIALSAYLYLRAPGLPRGYRIVLGVMRALVLLMIVFVLLEPARLVTEQIQYKRRLPILIDVSESMSLRDQRKLPADIVEAGMALGIVPLDTDAGVDELSMNLDTRQRNAISSATRLELAGSLLTTSARGIFEAIGKDVDIDHYTFGESLHMLGNGDKRTRDTIAALKAGASATSIAESLDALASANAGLPLAGIVLLSDGIDTTSRRVEQVANDLGARGIPVYTVPVGIEQPDDVSIRSVIMQDVAFAGDTVPIRVQVRSKGYEKRSAEMTLVFNGVVVSRRNVLLKGGLQNEDISFDVRSLKKGAARIEVAIEPFADEAASDNNRVERSLRVVNDKINVLCIEGSARWEFRYLRAILKRDPRINAKFIATRAQSGMAQLSSDYIARFPEDAADAFKYDLVILGDVDSSFFTPAELTRLDELIRERGGSLLMLCGRHYAPSSYAGTPIERMLPVKFDPAAPWEDVDETVHPVLTSEGRSSLVMTLETLPEKNDQVWSHVAPLDHLPPLLSPRPGAMVLAELSDSRSPTGRYPLVSWQRYGTGKCMLIATDRLWRLRFKTGDKYHWRVWSQSIQFLTLSRLMGEHKRIRLETDRSVYPGGEQARIYANVLDEDYEPITQSRYDVYITQADEENAEAVRVSLRPDAGNLGLYEGYFSPPRSGRYRLQAGSTDRQAANTIEFRVADVKPEMAHTELQMDRLRNIAELSGGRCLPISQLGELGSLLNTTPEVSTVSSEQPIWDHWLLAALILGLVGVEWIVRRRRDLP